MVRTTGAVVAVVSVGGHPGRLIRMSDTGALWNVNIRYDARLARCVPESFDVVLANAMFHHLPDPRTRCAG